MATQSTNPFAPNYVPPVYGVPTAPTPTPTTSAPPQSTNPFAPGYVPPTYGPTPTPTPTPPPVSVAPTPTPPQSVNPFAPGYVPPTYGPTPTPSPPTPSPAAPTPTELEFKKVTVQEAVKAAEAFAEQGIEVPAAGAVYKRPTLVGVEYMVEPAAVVRKRQLEEEVRKRIATEPFPAKVAREVFTVGSLFGTEYVASYLPEGKTPKEVRIKTEVAARGMGLGQWVVGALLKSPLGIVATGLGFGAVGGAVVGTAAQVPAIAARAQFFKGVGVMGTAVYGLGKAVSVERAVRVKDYEKVAEIGLRTGLELPSAYYGFKAGYEAVVPKPVVKTAFLAKVRGREGRGRASTFFRTKVGQDVKAGLAETILVKPGRLTSYGVTIGYADIEKGMRDPFIMLTKGVEIVQSPLAYEYGVYPFIQKARVIIPKSGIRGRVLGGYDVVDVGAKGVGKPVMGDFYASVGKSLSEAGVRGQFAGITRITVGAPLEALPGSSYGIVAPPTRIPMPPTIVGIGAAIMVPPSLAVGVPTLLAVPSLLPRKQEMMPKYATTFVPGLLTRRDVISQVSTSFREVLKEPIRERLITPTTGFVPRYDVPVAQELMFEIPTAQLLEPPITTPRFKPPAPPLLIPPLPPYLLPGFGARAPRRRKRRLRVKRKFRYTPTVLGIEWARQYGVRGEPLKDVGPQAVGIRLPAYIPGVGAPRRKRKKRKAKRKPRRKRKVKKRRRKKSILGGVLGI